MLSAHLSDLVNRRSDYGELGGDAFYEDWVEVVRYEDYKALKTYADAMCEAMCLYDLGERVSFEPYINYTEWLSSEGDV